MSDQLPWFLYFGRRLGMDGRAVRTMRFGEFQDLLACNAIYRGVAVEKKRKLTQEEMYELE